MVLTFHCFGVMIVCVELISHSCHRDVYCVAEIANNCNNYICFWPRFILRFVKWLAIICATRQSRCLKYQFKPKWSSEITVTGCAYRTDNDIKYTFADVDKGGKQRWCQEQFWSSPLWQHWLQSKPFLVSSEFSLQISVSNLYFYPLLPMLCLNVIHVME